MGQGDHPKTFQLKALCCQDTPSWLKVVGGRRWRWVVANEILLSALGLGVLSILYFLFYSQVPVPSPSPSRLTIQYLILLFVYPVF